MKKKLCLFSILFFTIIILCGCGNKKAITTRDFKNITEQSGLDTIDAMDQIESQSIKEVTLAYNDDYKLESMIRSKLYQKGFDLDEIKRNID